MYLGADYYPEHWEKERWPIDAELMQRAGISLARLAEFAWSKLEPEDDLYDFAWLDEAMDILNEKGVKVVLSTPTAAPPSWLIGKHPQILPLLKSGQRMGFGKRRHYCITNRTYYHYSERIIRKLAEHYKNNPQVIGWQIDNEFGNPKCYCNNCKKEFQHWLKLKYKTLQNLNQSWGNAFWSHDYICWEQIPLPIVDYHNPSFDLDFRRFFSDMNVKYSNMQVELLKSISPDKFVTHNFMGLFPELNYYDLAEKYDFVSWDNYPQGLEKRFHVALAHDVMRGLKKKNFWVMEQQCGCITREDITPALSPGEMRLWTYHSYAHGAEAVVYFRWRACTFGIEQFHSAILQHDGTDKSISYKETAQIASEIDRIRPQLEGSKVISPVAIIYDYENIWVNYSYQEKPMYNYSDEILRFYKTVRRKGINVDIVKPTDDFSKYKVIIAPLMYIVDDKTANNIKEYVKEGGTFIAGFRFGIKDRHSNIVKSILPGKLRELFGISIYAWDNLRERKIEVQTSSGEVYQADTFADLITPEKAKPLAEYKNSWHASYAAVTVNTFAEGKFYYVGCGLPQAFYDKFIAEILKGLVPEGIKVPDEVEITLREKNGKKFIFVMNFSDKSSRIFLNKEYTELKEKKKLQGEINFAPFEVLILL